MMVFRGGFRTLPGRVARVGLLCLWVGLAACSPLRERRLPPQEKFGSVATYSRIFDASPANTCEAARRALLSQGYIVNASRPEQIEGMKNFQPENEMHVQMTIRVVCLPDSGDGKISLGFVTAVQDRYALKKSNSSASLGLGGLGSVSLPFASANESLVKVGSETIASDAFYDNFFDLVKRYLLQDEQLGAGMDDTP